MDKSEIAVIVQQDSEKCQVNSGPLTYRLQKKVLPKVFTRNVMKHFADDTLNCLFDDLYNLLASYYEKSVAEKVHIFVLKDLTKLIVKLSLTESNGQFNSEQHKELDQIRYKLRNLCLTVISFVNVSFSYNQDYLQTLFAKLYSSLRSLVGSSLSEKSLRRVDFIFEHLSKVR
uniref:Dedicator of cytokinesis 10 n=1 Tax=Syphacia muris TaxID=451379 RepID=A0A0N5AXI7_9BILA